MEKTICELFAGVGGFRLGFERLNSGWQTVWFNQWEPNKNKQWAYVCYVSHFCDCYDLNGEIHTNDDISIVDKSTIPDHTLLVGGFPCQDYSVASSLSNSKGIEGKKGVLWWQIRDVIEIKKPKFCLFENVDRILKSPANQRGRDFGIILKCLNDLGYVVEWRVINAAQYGGPQRRRRTFIFAARNDTEYARLYSLKKLEDMLSIDGLMARSFPVTSLSSIRSVELPSNILHVSNTFNFMFDNAGIMCNGIIYSSKAIEKEECPIVVRNILENNPSNLLYIPKDKLEKWNYLKGAKKILRTSKNGHQYYYSEGSMAFPDPLDKPARTMLTSEGSLNRSTHVVKDPLTNELRILSPIEAERIQGFDDNWTIGMPNKMRYFCMGNALVVPMITRMGKILDVIVEQEKKGGVVPPF